MLPHAFSFMAMALSAPGISTDTPAGTQSTPALSREQRHDACIDLATGEEPDKAIAEASRWQLEGGGYLARQCLGLAYARLRNWAAAATEFENAATAAELAKDNRAARYWAQTGNARLAAGNVAGARAAFDTAIVSGNLSGLERGEAYLDRARARVGEGDLAGARRDIDIAARDAERDPLLWLLSATLARRMNDLARAERDIARALAMADDDAAVHLEAGNIAAAQGDEATARAAWQRASTMAPDSDAGRAAAAALAQFDVPGTAPAPATAPDPATVPSPPS